MHRIRSLLQPLALAGAAVLGTVVFYPGWAVPADRGISMNSMSRGATSVSGPQVASQPRIVASELRIAGRQHITLYVLPSGSGLGFMGPDGAHHDTVVPSSFVLRKGVPVTFTVINLDDMSHSITAPGLGINIIVKPGVDRRNRGVSASVTAYTFTPAKLGEFRWFCVIPCDMPHHWAMSASSDGPDRDGYMAGIFRVL